MFRRRAQMRLCCNDDRDDGAEDVWEYVWVSIVAISDHVTVLLKSVNPPDEVD